MKAFERDLARLRRLAFHRADWAAEVLRDYHAAEPATVAPLQRLYEWLFVPYSLWPFNVQDVLAGCLKAKRLNPRQRLLIELLPAPPDDSVCACVTEHEQRVRQGLYENILTTPAKYTQNEMVVGGHRELRRQWQQIKSAFDVAAYRDHKGVIRRTMNTERNLRGSFAVNVRRPAELFQAAFDAFCLRWNLYGMQKDEPLPLKLAVNITAHGTMIHIPAYWSFDPKRDIRWDAIAKLHRLRVPNRQGTALAEGFAQRQRDAAKLFRLDKEAARQGLRGEKKHEFLCRGLGWDPRTSPKRLARLRTEFKNR